MTSEVAILNRSCAALAADSALTTGLPGQEKVFYGASKIFTLSKFHPVGIMVYGSSDFFSIPRETVIKTYRAALHNHSFSFIKEYKDNFLSFISQPRFVTEHQQDIYILIATLFTHNTLINRLEAQGQKVTAASIKKALDKMSQFAEGQGVLNEFSDIRYATFSRKYGNRIESILYDRDYFDLDIPKSCWPRFKRCVFDHLRSNMTSTHLSGLVFVGYGEDELFPTLQEIRIDGGFFDKLRLFEGRNVDIGRGQDSIAVEAFAQRDVVESFVHGYERRYKSEVLRMLKGFLTAQIEDIIENHTKYDEDSKKAIRHIQVNGIDDVIDQFSKRLDFFANEKYTEPAFDVLRHATKDELAELAEALVNLTSMKRRVSLERETVGGSVDVAVISKGDGFIWIKRKHYFEGKMNYHFFENYFRNPREEMGGGNKERR